MLIRHNQNNNKGSFVIGEEGNYLAEMAYTMPSDDKMIIEHTEVDDELRGKNIGHQLVNTAVEFARANNIKIIPRCTFANSVFKKRPELQDVLFNE